MQISGGEKVFENAPKSHNSSAIDTDSSIDLPENIIRKIVELDKNTRQMEGLHTETKVKNKEIEGGDPPQKCVNDTKKIHHTNVEEKQRKNVSQKPNYEDLEHAKTSLYSAQKEEKILKKKIEKLRKKFEDGGAYWCWKSKQKRDFMGLTKAREKLEEKSKECKDLREKVLF